MAGRFISEDPLGVIAGMNQYLYANADPVEITDPRGLEEQGKPCPEKWHVKMDNGEVVLDEKGNPKCEKDGGGGDPPLLPQVTTTADRVRIDVFAGLDLLMNHVAWGEVLSDVRGALGDLLTRLTTPDPASYQIFGKAAELQENMARGQAKGLLNLMTLFTTPDRCLNMAVQVPAVTGAVTGLGTALVTEATGLQTLGATAVGGAVGAGVGMLMAKDLC